MPKDSRIAFLVLFLSGCAATQPERVYVSIDRVIASSGLSPRPAVSVPQPKPAPGAVIVKQAGLPATTTTDRTLERLESAKELIAQNRTSSIAGLSSMLKQIYLAQANDEITKQEKDAQPERDTILKGAIARVVSAFDDYGAKRGPLLRRLNQVARSTDLTPVPVTDQDEGLRRARLSEANDLRSQIRKLDSDYNAQATGLLLAAQSEIQSEIDALAAQAKKLRGDAESRAVQEAETQASATQTSLNVQITKLVPEQLSSVPARQVAVPGGQAMPPPPDDKGRQIFGSLDERRSVADREIEIWIRTTGRSRAKDPKGSRDATDEFLQWRRAHRVGP